MCSDTGASAGIWSQAKIAISAAQLYIYEKIASRQLDLAEKIDARADDLHNIWKDIYLPCELSTLQELCSTPIEVANLELVESRVYADVGRQFAANRTKALYCLPYTAAGARCETNTRFAIEQAKAEAGMSQIARNQEIARVELKNAQRQVNIVTMLNLGRGGTAVAANLAATAGQQYQQVASQAASAFNGALKSLGRLDEQNRASNTAGVQSYATPQQDFIPAQQNTSMGLYSPSKDAMHATDVGNQTSHQYDVNPSVSPNTGLA